MISSMYEDKSSTKDLLKKMDAYLCMDEWMDGYSGIKEREQGRSNGSVAIIYVWVYGHVYNDTTIMI